MRYYVLDDEEALRFLDAAPDLQIEPPAGRIVGEGDLIDLGCFDRLSKALNALGERPEYREPLRQRDPRGGKFESEAAEIVHRHLQPIDRGVLGDSGFWVWLSVTRFRRLIGWRYGVAEGPARASNYGIAQPKEGFLFRLWLRADYFYDPSAADPYALSRLGDQDLWRSHIFRQEFAAPIAATLLKLQAGQLGLAKLTNRQIRALAKELHRVGATIRYEALSHQQAMSLVVRMVERVG